MKSCEDCDHFSFARKINNEHVLIVCKIDNELRHKILPDEIICGKFEERNFRMNLDEEVYSLL
jgi:hypothetical protein